MSWHIHDDMSFADSDAYGIDTDIPEGDGEPDPWDAPYDEDESFEKYCMKEE